MKGKVILVGAGPGDVGLLTLNAVEAIKTADVIVYDRLVSDEIMSLIPNDVEKVDVGKENNRHTKPQEEINKILCDFANEGKRVVRLKGGDPFVFGRGGEELDLVHESGVEFEVVPGVTSSTAVPAYAGIPVTHRDFCSSFHVLTGHAKAGSKLDIKYRALTELGGTIVLLMSLSTINELVDGFMNAGMSADMPCAVIENGTRKNQRKVVATISTIVEKVKEEKVKSPAIIVIGKTCALNEKYDWFNKVQGE